MRKSPFLVAALLAAAPASALMVRTQAPQTVGAGYRAPSVVQTRALGSRPLQPTGFSLNAPQMTPGSLALSQSLIQQAPESRVSPLAGAPMAALSSTVGRWDSLLNAGAPGERLSNQQALFDGKRLSAGSEGNFAASTPGSKIDREAQELLAAVVELSRLLGGEASPENIRKTAELVKAIEDGRQTAPADIAYTLEEFARMSEEALTEMFGIELADGIRAGKIAEADRRKITEQVQASIATLVRIQNSWARILVAAAAAREIVDALVEVDRLLRGTNATEAILAERRADLMKKIPKIAAMVQAIENGEQVDPGELDTMLYVNFTDFDFDARSLMVGYTSTLEAGLGYSTPKADRAKVLGQLEEQARIISRVYKQWERTLRAVADKSPKFGSNLLSQLENMRGGAKFSVTLTFDEDDASSVKTIRAFAKQYGVAIKFMGEVMGVAVLGELGIDGVRELAAIPQISRIDLESNSSIH